MHERVKIDQKKDPGALNKSLGMCIWNGNLPVRLDKDGHTNYKGP